MVIVYDGIGKTDKLNKIDDIECLVNINYIKQQTKGLCNINFLFWKKQLRTYTKNYSPLFKTYLGKELQKYNCSYEELLKFQKSSYINQFRMYCK